MPAWGSSARRQGRAEFASRAAPRCRRGDRAKSSGARAGAEHQRAGGLQVTRAGGIACAMARSSTRAVLDTTVELAAPPVLGHECHQGLKGSGREANTVPRAVCDNAEGAASRGRLIPFGRDAGRGRSTRVGEASRCRAGAGDFTRILLSSHAAASPSARPDTSDTSHGRTLSGQFTRCPLPKIRLGSPRSSLAHDSAMINGLPAR
jgi:hypothetical protein